MQANHPREINLKHLSHLILSKSNAFLLCTLTVVRSQQKWRLCTIYTSIFREWRTPIYSSNLQCLMWLNTMWFKLNTMWWIPMATTTIWVTCILYYHVYIVAEIPVTSLISHVSSLFITVRSSAQLHIDE